MTEILENQFYISKPKSTLVKNKHFYICNGSQLQKRNDLIALRKSFLTKVAAEQYATDKGYVIKDLSSNFLDCFDEESKTVWCWKDEETFGSSQVFKSKKAALDAWRKDQLVFDILE